MTDFQKLLDTITRAKDNIEQAMLKQRDMYEQKLESLRADISTGAALSGSDGVTIGQIRAAETQIGNYTMGIL